MSTVLEGKTAVVTGGARGIGRAIATNFAEHGCRVVVLDSDDMDMGGLPGNILAVRGSVTDATVVREAISVAVGAGDRLDVMVCNAGILRYEPFLDLGMDTWQKTVDVDLTGVFVSAQEAARAMAQGPQSSPSIIVITSISAEMPSRTQGHYAAAKAGAQMLAQAMAWELGASGIRVNSIGPGWVETRLTTDYLADPELRSAVEATIPLGRVGQPSDIANVALFLAGDQSSYVTGAHIRVDGGLIIGMDKM